MSTSPRRHFELLTALIGKEFKVRYKSTTLGFLWSLANPIFFALVFFIALKHIMRVPIENYFAFLLAGLFPWQWFANTVNSSPTVFLGNAGLIKKVYFPRILIPMSMAGNHLIHFVLALLVSIPVLAFYGATPSVWWIPGVPLLLATQALVVIGLSLMLGSLNVFFRDLEHLTGILTNLLFYLTPVIYPEDRIPQWLRPILWLNPMASIIPSWRNLMLHGTVNWTFLGLGLVAGFATFFLGYVIYRALEWRFAESI